MLENDRKQALRHWIMVAKDGMLHKQNAKVIDASKRAIDLIPTQGKDNQTLTSYLYNQIGEVYFYGYHDEHKSVARSYFEMAIRVDHQNSYAYQNLALLNLRHHPDQAVICTKRSIKLGLKSSVNYELLGIIDSNNYQHEQAIHRFQQSLAISENVKVYQFLAEEESIMTDYEQSEKDYKKAIHLKPNDGEEYFNLGDLYANEMKLPHLAIKCFHKAIQLDKHNGDYYANLATVQDAIGKTADAIDTMENAIKYDPQDARKYYKQGQMYRELGGKSNLKLALNCFKQGCDLSDRYMYYFAVGKTELDLKDYVASIKDMHQANDLFPNPDYVYQIANLYNDKGLWYGKHKNDAESQYCYKAAIEFAGCSTYYYNLARAYQNLGRNKEAIKVLKKGLKIGPNDENCQQLLDQLQPKLKNSVQLLDYDPKINYVHRLDGLIGLTSVKAKLKHYVDRAVVHKARTGKSGHGEIHVVLEGNPGTGKTTVAKLLCQILYQKHLIRNKNFVTLNATQLIGWRYGESAKNMRKFIKKAKGGVLFIDEAYHLAHRSDGNSAAQDEIMAEFLPDIEKYRDDLVVIMAGYPKAMERFITRSNPGLSSRFPDRIKFPDYTNAECRQILDKQLHKHDFKLQNPATKRTLNQDFEGYINANRTDTRHTFANARTVRNIYMRLTDAFAVRIADKYNQKRLKDMRLLNSDILNTITTADVKAAFKKYSSYRNSLTATQILNGLIGLKQVKAMVKSFVRQAVVRKVKTGQKGHDRMDMVFEGNPGTGKTTVAKLFCRILYQKGITKSPNYVYISASHLENGVIGKSAKNMREAFREAKDGVLFIDEAYALGNLGNESMVDQLVSDISKYKNHIVVILAGYPKPMEKFLNQANAGLSSRFSDRVKFPDYTDQECQQILNSDLRSAHLTVSSASTKQTLRDSLQNYVSKIRNHYKHQFGNARTVNNYFKYLRRNMDNRIGKHSVTQLKAWKRAKSSRLNRINLCDVEATDRQMKRLAKMQTGTSEYGESNIGFQVAQRRPGHHKKMMSPTMKK